MFGSCFGNAVNKKCSLASFRSVYCVAVWNSQCLNGHWEKTVQGLLDQKSDSEEWGYRCGFTVLLCTMKVTVKLRAVTTAFIRVTIFKAGTVLYYNNYLCNVV